MPPHHAVSVIRLEPKVQGGHPLTPLGRSASQPTHQSQRGFPRAVTVGSGPCYQSLTPQGLNASVIPAGHTFARNCRVTGKVLWGSSGTLLLNTKISHLQKRNAHTNVKLASYGRYAFAAVQQTPPASLNRRALIDRLSSKQIVNSHRLSLSILHRLLSAIRHYDELFRSIPQGYTLQPHCPLHHSLDRPATGVIPFACASLTKA